jgi:enoyl-CoA hydratase/carnithine racemase
MAYKFLNLKKKDHIAIAELNDYQYKDEDLLDLTYEFSDLCSYISSNDDIFIFIIISKGKNSLNFIGKPPEKELDNVFLGFDIPFISESISSLDIPVIIGMNGNIFGQGLELALACDIRIATKSSKFGFPHLGMGMMPFDGGTQRLPRMIGRTMALGMMLTGDTFDAKTGYRLGLINGIVKKEELDSEVNKIATDMSEKGPLALNYIKEAVHKGMDLTLDQGLRLEADLYFLLHSTSDRQEGIRAFQEKRKPIFRGE